jgi:predicted NBD/HSP70 family sugar kinase
VQRVRRNNRSTVLQKILANGGAPRSEVADQVGLSTMAVSRIIRELLEVGLVEEGEKASDGGRGRRWTRLRLGASGAYVLGLSITAYDQSIAIGNVRGDVLMQRPVKVSLLQEPLKTLREIAAAAERLIAKSGVDRHRILGAGVVIAGFVDQDDGFVSAAPYLGWGRTDVAGLFTTLLNMPTVVENVSHAVNLAEVRFGSCKGKKNVILARIATGVGGSFLIDGRLLRGANSGAGQIAHMPVRGVKKRCFCGQMGCLHTVGSGWAVLEELQRAKPVRLSATEFVQHAHMLFEAVDAANSGERRSIAAFRAAGRYLGEALRVLLPPLDPEQVLLTGVVSRCAPYWEGVNEAWTNSRSEPSRKRVGLSLSAIDGYAAAIFLALGEFVFSPRLDMDQLRRAAKERPKGTVARASVRYSVPSQSPAAGKRQTDSAA